MEANRQEKKKPENGLFFIDCDSRVVRIDMKNREVKFFREVESSELDAVGALILNHLDLGVEIDSPLYIEGIKETILNNLDID